MTSFLSITVKIVYQTKQKQTNGVMNVNCIDITQYSDDQQYAWVS